MPDSGYELPSQTAGAYKIPVAASTGKIENPWLNTGSGNGLDADTVDGSHAAAFEAAGAAAAAVAAHEGAADPHTGYQKESEKAAASGYASLDAGTKVPIAQIPTGTSSTTVCIGDDARLSDARTPLTHAMSTHTDEGALATLNTVGTAQIDDAAVTMAKITNIGQDQVIGRVAVGSGAPIGLSATQLTTIPNAVVGDAGAGGTKGMVPAPAAGDAAAGKFLKADGTWAAPAAGQPAIQFKDEGTNEGSAGGISTVNFTGAGVTASDSGATLTVNIPGGAGEAFPVGSVFIGVVSTNPGTLLGYGTWSAIAAGRVLVGLDSGDTDFDTVEETGGAKTVASAGTNAAEAAHTHTYTQVPNHVHVQNLPSGQTGSQASGTRDTSTTGSTADALSTANPTGGVATATTDGGSSHNHAFTGTATSVVQPYFVVYMWKRTA